LSLCSTSSLYPLALPLSLHDALPILLSLMPNMKTEGVNIGEVASKLDNIQILSCEKPDIIAKLKKETAFISPKNGYEELMRINEDRKSTRLNSSHVSISYAVFCLKKK